MGRLLRLAVAYCSIVVAEAAIFKWNTNDAPRWTPAQETLGVMPLLGMNPMPTSPPGIRGAKEHKRASQDNTCAYVNGDPGMYARAHFYGAPLTRTKTSLCTAMSAPRVSIIQ